METAVPPTDEEIIEISKQVSNWGRWGPDDQLGTLNFITPEKRRAAIATVSDGESVSLARPLPLGKQPAIPQSVHTCWHLTGRVEGASDFIGMVFHNWSVTHLDCLSHVHDQGLLYNGRNARQTIGMFGAEACAVDSVHSAISGRGVLLDIAASRGIDEVTQPEAILPADLEVAEEFGGVTVGSGDLLFVRFGSQHWHAEDSPGLNPLCVPWLREREVALLATDVNSDVFPRRPGKFSVPIHQLAQVYLGMPLIDNCLLQDVSTACAKRQRYEFFVVVAPLNMPGVTGSPVNPIAFF